MSGLRVVLVTRRYWPLLGAAENLQANLASELARLGARPRVVTAQFHKWWPTELMHREMPIVRLAHPATRLWGTYRYLGFLSRWLREHRSEIDVACVSTLGYDAYTVLGALSGSGVPVVLRAERGGSEGDCERLRRASFGARVRRRCLSAQAVIAPTEKTRGELIASGFDAHRIHLLRNGVAASPVRDAGRRAAARASLAEAHPILGVAEDAPLVVCAGRIADGKGLVELVNAWPAIMRRWPQAKLWLVGQGPAAETVWRQIERHYLKNDVILTGLFDDLSEVLLAADLFVHPATTADTSLAVLEAMAAGLPIVAADVLELRETLLAGEHAMLVPPGNSAALSAAITQLLTDRVLASRLATAAQQHAQERFSLTRMAAEHLELFERLRGGKSV